MTMKNLTIIIFALAVIVTGTVALIESFSGDLLFAQVWLMASGGWICALVKAMQEK